MYVGGVCTFESKALSPSVAVGAAMASLSFIVRGSEGLTLLAGPPFDAPPDSKLNKIPCAGTTFSKDGSKLVVITASAVTVYDPTTCSEMRSLPLAGVVSAVFSPCGTYLQTFQKASGQEKNVGIWDLKTGSGVLLLFQKSISKTTWPVIQFSEDETVACRLVTNDVHIYDAKDFSKGIVDHLRLPGIQAVQLATAPPSHLATYVPESKGQPAIVRIFNRTQVSEGQPISRRSFFKSSSVNMTWNRGSTGLLVMAYSDDDKSNQSYYGESRLHYLKSDGSHEGTVPLNKEGPIHDAQWSPTGKEFIVVYGYMPAKATLFDTQCRPLFDFGSGPYNTARWNSFGTFVCLAGFGNLPGDMAFWDRSTFKQMGSTKAACSVTCEWSPDGRLLMTATTAPRMQVDNGIKVFKYTGALLEEKKFEKLYQADWRPGVFTDRPPSPDALKSQQKSTVATAKPAAYRPPNSSNSAAVRAQLFGEDEKPQKTGGELSKSALKNKKRREKQKEKPEGASETDWSATEEKLAAISVSETPPVSQASGGDEVGKKLRALNKKLRQLEELKAKISSGGQAPSQQQQDKLDQEAELREEIRKLETP